MKGRLAGSVKRGAGLTFIEVISAGHMVPLNQPLVVRGERGRGGECALIVSVHFLLPRPWKF